MGDTFQNVAAGVTIINRSSVTNAFNVMEGQGKKELADAFKQIETEIQKSGNVAGSLLILLGNGIACGAT